MTTLYGYGALALGLLSTSLMSPGTAIGAPRGVITGPVGILHGNLWEDGGWAPPFVVDDELHAVGSFEGDSDTRLPWEPETYAYTFWLRGFLAEGESFHDTWRQVWYRGPGTLGIYREKLPSDQDFGTNPPNPTSPGSFADGDLVLECSIESAYVVVDSGGARATLSLYRISYVGGDYLAPWLAYCGECEGDLYGNLSSATPAGYDFSLEASLDNLYTLSVEPRTWGRVKALYR